MSDYRDNPDVIALLSACRQIQADLGAKCSLLSIHIDGVLVAGKESDDSHLVRISADKIIGLLNWDELCKKNRKTTRTR